MTGIAVVGPHRSGTSAVMGVIRGAGFYVGDDLYPPSEHNPMGYYEDRDIVAIHDRMIGGKWFDPRPLEEYLTSDLLVEYSKEIARFNEHERWAIKDPRLCITLPALRKVTDEELRIISVYRDPWNSARSLVKRDNMAFSMALELSLLYLKEMIRNTGQRYNILRIRYLDVISNPKFSTKRILSFADINYTDIPPNELDAIVATVDPSLAHWENI